MSGVVTGDDPFLLIHYTQLCNAACAHCVVGSGPDRHGRMPFDVARRLIESANRVARLRMVVFSGGESFIYLDDVLRLCGIAREQGLQTRIITNGYWARTPADAARMLTKLVDGSVDQLVVSFSEFHRAYVPAVRVRNVFEGARLAERVPFIAYSAVVPPQFDRDEDAVWPAAVLALLNLYGFAADECHPLSQAVEELRAIEDAGERARFKRAMTRERAIVNWEPLVFGGRAASTLTDRIRLFPLTSFDAGSPCAAAGTQLTATVDGRLFPCCSAWSNHRDHAIADANEDADAASHFARLQSDPLVTFIHTRGPGALVARLRARGVALPSAYSDICHMCDTLFARCSLDQLRAAVESDEAADLLACAATVTH